MLDTTKYPGTYTNTYMSVKERELYTKFRMLNDKEFCQQMVESTDTFTYMMKGK